MANEKVAEAVTEVTETATSAISSELDKQLVEILQGVTSTAGSAKDFVLAELPDVVAQMLAWYGIYNFIFFILGIALLTFTIWFTKNNVGPGEYVDKENSGRRHWTLTHDNSGDINGHIVATGSAVTVAIIAGVAMLNLEWLKIWIAPKLWLIEYTAQLVR